jgi:signal peptidase I
VIAFLIALLIKTFIVQAFYIPSESMEDTLLRNDRVLVSKFVYRFSEPEPGDVIVFVAPPQEVGPVPERGPVGKFFDSLLHGLGLRSSERDFIKRLVATEGQTVQIKGGRLYVDGKRLDEPYIKDHSPMPDFPSGSAEPYKVPEGALFVMGDNRFNSRDSRAFSAIKRSSVVGRAFVVIWPPGRLRILH